MTRGLVKRAQSTVRMLAEDRSKCDQMQTSKHRFAHDIVPTSYFLVTLHLPIKALKDSSHMLKDKNMTCRKQ